MTDIHLLTQIIARLDTNQMALQASIEEIALWIRQRGSEDVAENVASALYTLTENSGFIADGIAELTVSAGVAGWQKG